MLTNEIAHLGIHVLLRMSFDYPTGPRHEGTQAIKGLESLQRWTPHEKLYSHQNSVQKLTKLIASECPPQVSQNRHWIQIRYIGEIRYSRVDVEVNRRFGFEEIKTFFRIYSTEQVQLSSMTLKFNLNSYAYPSDAPN